MYGQNGQTLTVGRNGVNLLVRVVIIHQSSTTKPFKLEVPNKEKHVHEKKIRQFDRQIHKNNIKHHNRSKTQTKNA